MTATEAPMNIQRRIQQLLTLAGRSDTPEHERESAREKAEVLMAKHRLDRAMLNFTQKDPEQHRKPTYVEVDEVNLISEEALATGSRRDWIEHSIEGRLKSLMNTLYQHAGCKTRYGFEPIPGSYAHRHFLTVVGFEEDIYYGEVLWNAVFLDIIVQMYPSWSSERTFDRNVYTLKEAGYSWSQVREMGLAKEAGDHNGKLSAQNAGSKLRTAYKREAKRLDRELPVGYRQPSNPHLWRESFVDSYIARIGQRVAHLAAMAKGVVTDDNLPAIIDDKDRVKRYFWELFPDLHPDEIQKRVDEYNEKHKDDPEPKAVKERKQKLRTADMSAWRAGYEAANKVNLTNNKAAGDKKEALS